MLTINIFKDQLIRGFVYHVVMLCYILLLGNLTDKDFSSSVLNKSNTEISCKFNFVLLKPPPHLALLFNQFNNSFPELNIDPENVISSRYFDIDQIQSNQFPRKEKKSLSFFHINVCSLTKNFDDLVYIFIKMH